MATLGGQVAVGRTSEVFAYGNDSVVKVPRPTVPDHWANDEAQFTRAALACGVPAPEVRDVIEVDGRSAIVFERIDGPSMWQCMLDQPQNVDALSRELAAVHRTIQLAGIADGLPDLVARLCTKIMQVDALSDAERDEACALTRSLPRGAALLHGDLHPGNVLMGPDGPTVIDWFDATIGHPVADVARTSLLIRTGGHDAGDDMGVEHHLPGATPDLLDRVRTRYLGEFRQLLDQTTDTLPTWDAVIAVSRIAEGTDDDEAELLAQWHGRPATSHQR